MARFGSGAVVTAALLALLLAACDHDDGASRGGCRAGVCGYVDHLYFSTYACGGLNIGYSWRGLDRCVRQCEVATTWGCSAASCAGGCAVDHGSGAWLPCTEENRGEETEAGCFLPTSGMNGETVPCDCR